jgi:hypothetical protein
MKKHATVDKTPLLLQLPQQPLPCTPLERNENLYADYTHEPLAGDDFGEQPCDDFGEQPSLTTALTDDYSASNDALLITAPGAASMSSPPASSFASSSSSSFPYSTDSNFPNLRLTKTAFRSYVLVQLLMGDDSSEILFLGYPLSPPSTHRQCIPQTLWKGISPIVPSKLRQLLQHFDVHSAVICEWILAYLETKFSPMRMIVQSNLNAYVSLRIISLFQILNLQLIF